MGSKTEEAGVHSMREVVVSLAAIRRPLERSRDESKVARLMEAIAAEGQKEPSMCWS
jgi:hypothetical protein